MRASSTDLNSLHFVFHFRYFTCAGENNIIKKKKIGRAITAPENVIDSHYTHKDPGVVTTQGKLVTMKMNGLRENTVMCCSACRHSL